MKSKKYKKGRFAGDDNGIFEQGKTYRGKFVAFEHCILLTYQSHTYQSRPQDWIFNDEWEVK